MSHIEKRANLWYALLTVPKDVRDIIGKIKFVQSTGTADRAEALSRSAVLVAMWRAEIKSARGRLPDAKATFWDALRADFIAANVKDEKVGVRIELESALASAKDTEEASIRTASTGSKIPLAPIVSDWKDSLSIAQKTIDQQHRDVSRMAAHFVNLEALVPLRVKTWTDQLIADGMTVSTVERLSGGCRSFWLYLTDVGQVPIGAANPFTGSLRLAKKKAKQTRARRQSFSPEEIEGIFQMARDKGDHPLASLIAFGAYTGARIEEICSLKLTDFYNSAFHITDAKTEAGIRTVPLHPNLKALMEELKGSSTDGYFIPSTSETKYEIRSDALSKRFGRLKTKMGFGKGFVFHSIRKTVSTQLERAGVPEGIAADIVGHEKSTMTYGLYSTGSSMEQKLKAIENVRYRGKLETPSLAEVRPHGPDGGYEIVGGEIRARVPGVVTTRPSWR